MAEKPYSIVQVGSHEVKGAWAARDVIVLNVANTGVRSAHPRESRTIKVDGKSYSVTGAVDPFAGVKDSSGKPHVNQGKFVEVYVLNGPGSRRSNDPKEAANMPRTEVG